MSVIRYIHHGKEVAVRPDLMGQHRAHCLCFGCGRFKPGEPDNCSIAQELYTLCVKHNLVTPVYECPEFTLPGEQ